MEESLLKMYDLTGKVAIVTGVSRGLGISFSRGLAKAGCHLTIAARNYEKLRDVGKELEQYAVQVLPLRIDVTRPGDVKGMVDGTVDRYGKIDILVNNAGIAAIADAERMSEEQWSSVMDTNVKGCFLCAQAAGRQMLKQGYGKIINIASMYGISASSCVNQVSYAWRRCPWAGWEISRSSKPRLCTWRHRHRIT